MQEPTHMCKYCPCEHAETVISTKGGIQCIYALSIDK